MNDTIFFFLYNLAHKSEALDKIIVFFAMYFPYMVVALALLFLLIHHDVFISQNPFKAFQQKWKEIVLVFFSGVLAWILAHVLKLFFHTPRPFVAFSKVVSIFSETGYAFPSGHATFYMALAFSLFFSHKKIGYVFMFFTLLIGLARIIAGVHFPVDILGGFILGALTAYFVRFLYQKLTKRA